MTNKDPCVPSVALLGWHTGDSWGVLVRTLSATQRYQQMLRLKRNHPQAWRKKISRTILAALIRFGYTSWLSGKESTCPSRRLRRQGFDLWVRKISWRRMWQPTPVFLPEEFHGQRSLVGHSPQHHKEQNMTEGLGQACIFISLTLIKHRITRENQITKNSSNLHAVVIQSTAEADNCSFSTTRKACDCNPPKIIRLMFSSLPCLHVSC